jgi:hypothetical protein
MNIGALRGYGRQLVPDHGLSPPEGAEKAKRRVREE